MAWASGINDGYNAADFVPRLNDFLITLFGPCRYSVLLYVVLHAARLTMMVMFMPLLQHMGYGVNWKECLIITYGGLRGAVGLALALIVHEDEEVLSPNHPNDEDIVRLNPNPLACLDRDNQKVCFCLISFL